MGKNPVRLKEVVYTLSNHHQNVMSGLWKDLPYKIEKKIRENWVDSLFLLIPVIGTYQYALSYKEKEKLHHRY